MGRRRGTLQDDSYEYDLILESKSKKNSYNMQNLSNKSDRKKKDNDLKISSNSNQKKVQYTRENIDDTMKNFKKVKELIDEESKIKKENIKQNKKKIKKKKFQKKKKKLIIFLIIIIILIIMVASLFILPIFKLDSSFIIDEGVEGYSADDISKAVGIEYGNNVFISLLKANKENITEKYPYIADIEFSYSFPNKIGYKLNIRNKRYYALNKENSKYYLLSDDGYILEEYSDRKLWKDEILTYGITFENKVKLGTKINEMDYEKLKNFEKFISEISKKMDDLKITRVTFENLNMKIYINSSVEVVFRADGNADKYNFGLLKLILDDVGNEKGTIDMTRENPTFVKK